MDGLNWYTYTGNNPVNFWDPFGLSDIRIKGTEKEIEDMKKNLRLITDDELVFVQEKEGFGQPVKGSYFLKIDKEIEGDKKTGTALIRDILKTGEIGRAHV